MSRANARRTLTTGDGRRVTVLGDFVLADPDLMREVEDGEHPGIVADLKKIAAASHPNA
ncbi:MAG: hypothetical protein OXK74_02200 [Gemmatimonadota bacterium]|nr:hypothetical protein [Gemmatimonadota bacterium]